MRDLVEHVEFDTIYHEHYCYFSCSSVDALMASAWPAPQRRRVLPRPARRHAAVARRPPRRTARRVASSCSTPSARAGMTAIEYYAAASPSRCAPCQHELRALLDPAPRRGTARRRLRRGRQGRDAPQQHRHRTRDLVGYVVDRNVHKQGKLMPGCRLPIRPVEVLARRRSPTTCCCSRGTSPTRSSLSRPRTWQPAALSTCPSPARGASRADASQERSNAGLQGRARRGPAPSRLAPTRLGGRIGHPIASEGSFHATASSAPGS